MSTPADSGDKLRLPVDERISGHASSATGDETSSKRENMRSLIERYFYQLLEGCSNKQCGNVNCKSSGQVSALTPNQAAAKALQLFFQGASLCDMDQKPCDKRRPRQTINLDQEESSSSSNVTICDKADEGAATSRTDDDGPNCMR